MSLGVSGMQEQLDSLRQRLDSASEYMRLDELVVRKAELEKTAAKKDLWDDPANARQITRELAVVSDSLELYARFDSELSDLSALFSLIKEAELKGNSNQTKEEILELSAGLEKLAQDLDELELRSLFSGEYDENDVICKINSGAGGNDAQDWAGMLLRMYQRWAERHNFETELVLYQPAEGGGITSAEFLVKGPYAYGNLRGEHGVHRLVRISPFSKEGKRETSFASMSVVPFLEDMEADIQIDEKDLRIDTYRSSGAGGQHVNVTDSAVRITHLPTGIVTSCQAERSQHQNRERAMQILVARLLDLEHKKRQKELKEITGESAEADFGRQIRSYVLHPYQMVKDERTDYETSSAEEVLGGDLDQFIQSYLHWFRQN